MSQISAREHIGMETKERDNSGMGHRRWNSLLLRILFQSFLKTRLRSPFRNDSCLLPLFQPVVMESRITD